ncbi:MAG: serine hydrolase [Desulfovibrionaceae bacterium]
MPRTNPRSGRRCGAPLSLVLLLSLWTLCLLPAAPARAAAPGADDARDPALHAPSAIVAEADTGLILYQRNPDRPIPPASLTKLLTLHLALDAVDAGVVSLDDRVTISRAAADTRGSRMRLRAGETLPLRELLADVAIASANDAAEAVAEFLAGTQKDFVVQMNLAALRLGMRESLFMNPHGLPNREQRTTARDMLVLARDYLRIHPEALALHSRTRISHNGYTGTNKNPLLGVFEGCDGLKTGYTRASGYNLVATARRDGVRLIAVILGAPNARQRAEDARTLLEHGFALAEQGLFVRMGGWPTRLQAEQRLQQVQAAGMPASVDAVGTEANPAYQVLCGPYADHDQARSARRELAALGLDPQYLVLRSRPAGQVRYLPLYDDTAEATQP